MIKFRKISILLIVVLSVLLLSGCQKFYTVRFLTKYKIEKIYEFTSEFDLRNSERDRVSFENVHDTEAFLFIDKVTEYLMDSEYNVFFWNHAETRFDVITSKDDIDVEEVDGRYMISYLLGYDDWEFIIRILYFTKDATPFDVIHDMVIYFEERE